MRSRLCVVSTSALAVGAVGISTFADLARAFDSGGFGAFSIAASKSPCFAIWKGTTVPRWPFPVRRVRRSRVAMRIASFPLHDHSKLSLRGAHLDSGLASGECQKCPHGGALFVSAWSELHMYSTRVSNNRVDTGGAMYARDGTTATTADCATTSNSAGSRGGAVAALGGSTAVATNCTMTSNSARGGTAVVATDCKMTSTAIATNCAMTPKAAGQGGAIAAVAHVAIEHAIARDISPFRAQMRSRSKVWRGASCRQSFNIVARCSSVQLHGSGSV